jgi:diguanylate cyclase (GGDEF)-like protein
MNQEMAPEQIKTLEVLETLNPEFIRFQEMITTGANKINSGTLQEAYDQGHISEIELGQLALALLKKIEPKAAEADIDKLTQLGNLRFFDEKLNSTIKELRYFEENQSENEDQRETPLQFLMIIALDMNFLKVLNDNYGHHAGDQGLIALSNRLKNSVEMGDVVARVGGDEFLILLPIESAKENIQENIFQRIKAAISDLTIDIQNQAGETTPFSIRVAMGYAILDKTDTQTTAEELKERADQAMYQNKKEMNENTR